MRKLQPHNPPDGLGLPEDVKAKAEEIYMQARAAKLSLGRDGRVVRAASVYAACRVLGYPITLLEVAQLHDCPRGMVGRLYRILARELGLKPAPETPESYIMRNKRLLSRRVVEKTLKILRRCSSSLVGRKPSAVAAAAAYLASDRRLKPIWLGEVFSTTPVSVRVLSKQMEAFLSGP